MIQITLTPEQEQFLEKQLKTGKYNNPQEVISKAFQLLEEQEDEIVLPSYIKGTESAKQLLEVGIIHELSLQGKEVSK